MDALPGMCVCATVSEVSHEFPFARSISYVLAAPFTLALNLHILIRRLPFLQLRGEPHVAALLPYDLLIAGVEPPP